MRVLFSSTRMLGHIRPLLPYADALLKHGHDVLVAAPEGAGAALHDAGLRHEVFGHPGDERLDQVWASVAHMPLKEKLDTAVGKIFVDLNARAALPGLRETFRAWKPDLIVRESMEYAAAVMAPEMGIPIASVATSNGHAEAEVKYRVTAQLDVLRAEAGLGPDRGAALHATPTFTSFPASLDGDAMPAGSPAPFRVRTAREYIEPDRAVPAWALDDGRPLVFITFGTLAAGSAKNHQLFRATIEAVATLSVRALLSTGADMDRAVFGTIPENVTIKSWVPQSEVYPRAAALVCHGGAGTVLAGLTHGLPMVLIPLTADQPDTARRVEETGAGIALFQPDAPSIRAAVERVLVDAEMRAAAGRVAREIAAMSSIDDAVHELQRLSQK